MTHPKDAEPIAQTNVTGNPVQRAASIIFLADEISGTRATDSDIADVLIRIGEKATEGNIRAVRSRLTKGRK